MFVSLRNPELPPSKQTQVQTRYLQSLTDGSRVFFVTGSYDATDALVLFASVTVTGGPAEGEFSRLVRGEPGRRGDVHVVESRPTPARPSAHAAYRLLERSSTPHGSASKQSVDR